LLGKIAFERLVEQEKSNKKLSQECKELRRNFDLAQAANLDLEKKVAELGRNTYAVSRWQEDRRRDP
jgi:dimeric dUTPase (all-alpha-NTP-PPase superfamily)